MALTGSQRLKFGRKEYLAQATTYTFQYPSKSYTGEDILLSATLTAWTPAITRTRRHAGAEKADTVVPYSNYLSFRDAHAADEGKLFKEWDDAFSTADHVDGGFAFFVNIGMMHSLAQQFQWLTE